MRPTSITKVTEVCRYPQPKIPTTGPGNNLVPYFATKSLAAYSFPTAARKQAFFE